MASHVRLGLIWSVVLAACAVGDDSSFTSAGFSGTPPPTTTPPPPSETVGEGTTTAPGTTEVDPTGRPPDWSTGPGASGQTTGPEPLTGDATTLPEDMTTGEPATTGPVVMCGDMKIEGGEECEGANVNGMDCKAFGFTGGVLKCLPNCTYDKSMCTSESCGDGMINGGGEECDCGQVGSPCTGAQLGNQQCGTLLAPSGSNYHGGELTCGSPASCAFVKSACTYCGDGVRNGPEACEGADLGGQSCQSLGFTGGGALKCSLACQHDTSGCVNMVCGDGQCQPGEDSCSCPGDCPDDPNTCSPCQCGMYLQPCACDAACLQFGDCCVNGPC